MLTYIILAQLWKPGNEHWHTTINQWCAAKAGFQEWDKGSPDLQPLPISLCFYFYHGLFQPTNKTLLDMKLHRISSRSLVQGCPSTPLLLAKLQTLLEFHLFFTICPFSVPGPMTIPQPPLFFHDLDTW